MLDKLIRQQYTHADTINFWPENLCLIPKINAMNFSIYYTASLTKKLVEIFIIYLSSIN